MSKPPFQKRVLDNNQEYEKSSDKKVRYENAVELQQNTSSYTSTQTSLPQQEFGQALGGFPATIMPQPQQHPSFMQPPLPHQLSHQSINQEPNIIPHQLQSRSKINKPLSFEDYVKNFSTLKENNFVERLNAALHGKSDNEKKILPTQYALTVENQYTRQLQKILMM